VVLAKAILSSGDRVSQRETRRTEPEAG
jgi:hypothetical protein